MARNNKPQAEQPEQIPVEPTQTDEGSAFPSTESAEPTPGAPSQGETKEGPQDIPPPPEATLGTGAKLEGGAQYEIIYETRDHNGKNLGERTVNVTARSEAEAFDLAAKALEAIVADEEPITWRYTGRFRKISS